MSELNTGKLSNYIGQAKKDEKLDGYLVSVDRDLQNLWRIVNSISPLIGSARSVLETNSTIGFTYIPLVGTNPLTTPTNYTGHTALVFCNSNSNLYIYNSSDNNWKVEALT